MIEIIFYFGTEIVIARIDGHSVMLGSSSHGAMLAPIDGLKLNRDGVIKEFPDLKDNPEWNAVAIERFKKHLYSLKSEDKIADYVISDLRKFGYQPKYKQKAGFRPEIIS